MRWLIMILFLAACAQSPDACDTCDTDEFINKWWIVEADNELIKNAIGSACYSFVQWEWYPPSDTAATEFNYLYAYDPAEDPDPWYVGAWTLDDMTFTIENSYTITLYKERKNCYDIGTEISGTLIDGSACPCPYKGVSKF